MTYTIHYTADFADPAFQAAFRTYFGELGCRVTNWEGLFAAMARRAASTPGRIRMIQAV